MSSDLPAAARALLDAGIVAIEQLEVLLSLWRDRPARRTVPELAHQLGSTASSIEHRLQGLQALRLVTSTPQGWCWSGEAHAAAVAEIEQAYRERRVAVITYIINRPNATLQAFSDAFRLRQDRRP